MNQNDLQHKVATYKDALERLRDIANHALKVTQKDNLIARKITLKYALQCSVDVVIDALSSELRDENDMEIIEDSTP